MSTIEQLTDDDRRWLTLPGSQTWPEITRKALRIIDAQAEAIERLTAQAQRDFNLAAEWQATAEGYRVEAETQTTRAEKAERERDEARRLHALEAGKGDAARAECSALRAEVERLKVECELAWNDEDETKRANAAESRLAAEKAEVERLQAELADQPALCFECCYTHRPSEGHGRRRDIG
jgi:hypothetical protein